MPSGAAYGYAKAVAVSDGKIYTAGYYVDKNQKLLACYWVNGQRKDLPMPGDANSSDTVGIAVLDKTVYIAGYYYDANDYPAACYWENGEFKKLPLPNNGVTQISFAFAVAGSDGKSYIAGQYHNSSGKSTPGSRT